MKLLLFLLDDLPNFLHLINYLSSQLSNLQFTRGKKNSTIHKCNMMKTQADITFTRTSEHRNQMKLIIQESTKFAKVSKALAMMDQGIPFVKFVLHFKINLKKPLNPK